MSKNLYPEIRRQEILKKINDENQVTVIQLSEQYEVSEVTIRTDLQTLEDRGLIVRTHGGAISANNLPELSLNLRRQKQVQEKNTIGASAAKLVQNGEAIFLDISSTALALSRNLKQHRNLTVVTNSLTIAQELSDAPGVTVVVPGGTLQRDTISLVGLDGMQWIQKYNIQKGFFGAHGLGFPEGLTDVSLYEAEVKSMMVSLCKEVIGIIDSTKWGRVGLASFAKLEEIDVVITDRKADLALIEKAESFGIKIIQV
ncbi:MAG: DeoR/GlpR transcriptional regulator [Anaerolineaceae bacterium]|nr:DeoR/GlpR transcriptional regulator [Anaerolineaceae bacterium]